VKSAEIIETIISSLEFHFSVLPGGNHFTKWEIIEEDKQNCGLESHVVMECDYRWVLDCSLNLLDTLIQHVTTLYISLLHTHAHTSVHSHVFTAVAW
jgi:hypothetical protein